MQNATSPLGPSESRPRGLPQHHARWTAAVATLLLLTALFFVAFEQLQPPAALPASVPENRFSAYRALDKLREVARLPHPTGSAENNRVREYLRSELKALRLNPAVQTASVVRSEPKWSHRVMGATVNNLVARLPGTANTRPLMLVAHYDSVPAGPGASDDGSGTVTLLETARALEAGAPLRNDVIFLFTDAEEPGLLGAQAFVNEHPWAKEPGVVLNFEARGACGPSTMFETSAGNGWLIRQFAAASRYPVASSFTYEAYKYLPNDTDLTVFKRAGLAGLNFAYVGCWERYHTREDNLVNIDPRSLQHDGSYALALARRFGNLDLTHTRAPDAVYFNVWHWVVRYPESWTLLILGLGILLAIFVLVRGFHRRRLRWRGIVAGFSGWLVGTSLAAVISQLGWQRIEHTRFVSLLPYGMAYNGGYYAWAAVALTMAILSAVFATLFRWFAVESLAVGALLWWLLWAAGLSVAAPGASYLALWPLLASLTELAYLFARAPTRHPEDDTDSVLLWTLPAIVCILLAGMLPYLQIMLLGTPAIAPLAVMAALLVGFLAPQLHIITGPNRTWFSVVSTLVAVALVWAGVRHRGYSASRPAADGVFYALDADSRRAFWASFDRAPDAWTGQFLKEPVEKGDLSELRIGPRPIIKSAAPAIEIPPPELTTLRDDISGSRRQLALDLRFAPETRLAWVAVERARVTRATVNGKDVTGDGSSRSERGRPEPKPPWVLFYVAPPPGGLKLDLETDNASSPVVMVAQDTPGLPAIPSMMVRPRPPDVMPTQWWPPLDSSTVVLKTFDRFEANSAGLKQGK